MPDDSSPVIDTWQSLKADFRPRSLASTLITGAILALVNTLLTIALISLIFRGDLVEALPLGIGLALVSSAAIALILALRSSFEGLYAGLQDASAAIVGLSGASIAAALTASEALDSVLALISVTSFATGLVLLAMGYLGWGEVARFVPFPVIGGLLAGTGYLILIGSAGVVGVERLSDSWTPESLGLFWPALALAVALFFAARRGLSSRFYLLCLLLAVLAFHLVTLLAGVDRAQALERGWLLGPFPEGGLWSWSLVDSYANADWSAIAAEIPGLLTILIIVPITLLLYISALEIETKAELDMNRELQATGWANLASGVVGGPPGYLYLADTVIASRLVGQRRGPALVSPLVMLGVVALGGFVLELIPQFVVGGMLLFVGFEFLYEWLWASRRRMSVADYIVMWVILVVIATVGFLQGVAVGLVAATFLFVYRYSKVDVVKHELSGADHQSNLERSPGEATLLRSAGSAVSILELQGFVFFGTASHVLDRVKERCESDEPPRYLIVDFRRVTGVDSSAIAVFERVALMAREKGMVLVLTGLSTAQGNQFRDLVAGYRDVVELSSDLDHGLAWCEDRVLQEVGLGRSVAVDDLDDLSQKLAPYLADRSFADGEVLMRRGDPSPGIYLIRLGRATVLLDDVDGDDTRLRTLLAGSVLGEISLYRDEPCSATVVAEERCETLHLTPESFVALCRDNPQIAAELHAFIARTLAGRVSHANRAIRALHR